MQKARITHLLRLAESRVCGVAVHAVELRVVKHVENLGAELHAHPFVNWRHLEQAHVPVVDRRITAQRARRITKRSQRHAIIVQLRGIENETVGTRIVRLKWGNQVWLPWAFKPERASFQFGVVTIIEQDWEAALIRVNTLYLPSVQSFSAKSCHL